jgi:adenine-specific DNA methylase
MALAAKRHHSIAFQGAGPDDLIMQAALPLENFRQETGPDRSSKDAWRPIHYLGSKLRALPALETAINSVSPPGSPVCDLFAGSGTVSAWLARSRPVTAVDIQEYSRVLTHALLRPTRFQLTAIIGDILSALQRASVDGVLFAACPMIEEEERALAAAEKGNREPLAHLLEAGSFAAEPSFGNAALARAAAECRSRLETLPALPVETMVLRQFGGVYFSFRQAAEFDVILGFAHSMPQPLRTTLIAAVLSTASELVNTVGKHFAQPLRPRHKDGSIKRTLHGQVSRDRSKSTLDVFAEQLSRFQNLEPTPFEHQAIRSDYADHLLSERFLGELVYADPPYTRDHYSRFYHVLETLALRDDPEISTNTAHGRTVPSRGSYRRHRHQSPFCVRSEAPGAFETLFGTVAAKGAQLVMSYSPYSAANGAHPRVMTMDALIEIARRHFRWVDAASVGTFSHSRLNRSDLNKEISYDAEHLLICRS